MFVWLIFSIKYLLSLAFILISVAFFTLFEQKILGYSHNRFAPNKIFLFGLFQPFSDALKLFSKLYFCSKDLVHIFYIFSPILGIFLSLLIWTVSPFWGFLMSSSFSIMMFLFISGFSVYFLLYSGWSTSTKYSMFGSYRSSSQSVSYEVVMMLVVLLFAFFLGTLSYNSFSLFNSISCIFFIMFGVFLCWFLSCLAECNRSPFDFSEGESELVSGFNTEYGGGLFSLIFIGEYSSIIFLCLITSTMFFSSMIFFFTMMGCFSFLWFRSSFPRLRYDYLMMLCWKGLVIFLMSTFFVLIFCFI